MTRRGLGGLVLAWVLAIPALGEESWDAIYIGANKIGHTHVQVTPVRDSGGRALLRVQVNTVMTYKRGRDRANVEMRDGTIETTDGSVLRLDVRGARATRNCRPPAMWSMGRCTWSSRAAASASNCR